MEPTTVIRFGFKGLIPLLPNACVFKKRIPKSKLLALKSAFSAFKGALMTAGIGNIADKLFIEEVF